MVRELEWEITPEIVQMAVVAYYRGWLSRDRLVELCGEEAESMLETIQGHMDEVKRMRRYKIRKRRE